MPVKNKLLELEEILNGIYAADNGSKLNNNLADMIKIAGISGSFTTKEKRVKALLAYYRQKNIVRQIWDALNKMEREILTSIRQSNYDPLLDEIEYIVKKHGRKDAQGSPYYSVFNCFPKKSKLFLLYMQYDGNSHGVPSYFHEALAELIPPMDCKLTPVKMDPPYDGYQAIIDRAEFYNQFVSLIKLVNHETVSVNKTNGLMSKNALKSFYNLTRHREVFYTGAKDINGVKNILETVVCYAIDRLLRNAKVLTIKNGLYLLDKKADYFIGLDDVSKARFLFDTYKNHDDKVINECERTAGLYYVSAYGYYENSKIIQVVLQYLVNCPVMEWIDFNQYQWMIRRTQPEFSKDDANGRYRHYYYGYWDKRTEKHFIALVIMEYLSVLGITDALIADKDAEQGVFKPTLAYFRLTELGAYLLGVKESYTPKSKAAVSEGSGFIIQPNFEIIIPNSDQRLAYELYLDRFMKKVSTDEQVAVYKIDFTGIAAGVDIGLTVEAIYQYLETNASNPIPANIKTAFTDWAAKQGHIKIRTVTILETDDPYLLAELKSYRAVKNSDKGDIKHAVVIDGKDSKKIKAAAEKNNRFIEIGL